VINQLGSRPAVTAVRNVRATDAARLMKDQNIGAIVVVEGKKPIGIVTDRDIVTRIVAAGKDPAEVTVGEIMTDMPAVVPEDVGLHEALKLCGAVGIRRLPLVDRNGDLVGILSLDDLLRRLAGEMGQVASALARAQREPYEYVPL
jgi:CBS domain-containing protein